MQKPMDAIGVPPASSGKHQAILVVDDDPPVLKYVSRMLSSLGCVPIYQAASGDEALALWGLHREEIDLLVSDFVMPDLTGDQLAMRLLSDKPGLRILFISGNDPFSLDSRVPLEPGKNFLQKPFTAGDIRQLLNQPALAA